MICSTFILGLKMQIFNLRERQVRIIFCKNIIFISSSYLYAEAGGESVAALDWNPAFLEIKT